MQTNNGSKYFWLKSYLKCPSNKFSIKYSKNKYFIFNIFYLENEHSFLPDVADLKEFFFTFPKMQENHSLKKYQKMYAFLLNTRDYFQETTAVFTQNKLSHDNLLILLNILI